MINMFGKLSILAILGISLILFGCTGSDSGTNNQQHTAPSTDGPTEPSTGEEQGEQTEDVEQPAEEEPAGLDIATQTCFALMTSDLPVECTMKVTYSGETTTTKFYMVGQGLMRHEIETQSPDCSKLVVISKADKIFLGCEGQNYLGTSCAWYEAGSSESPEDAAAEKDSYDYKSVMEDMPTTECSCVPWVYDPEKLKVRGVICNQEELMQDLLKNVNS